MESCGFGVNDNVCPRRVLGCCHVLLYNGRVCNNFFLGTVLGVVVLREFVFSAYATLACGTVNRRGVNAREKEINKDEIKIIK